MKPYHLLPPVDRAMQLDKDGFPQPDHFAEGQVWYKVGGFKIVIVQGNTCLWAYHYYADTGRYFRKAKIQGEPNAWIYYSPNEQELEQWAISRT